MVTPYTPPSDAAMAELERLLGPGGVLVPEDGLDRFDTPARPVPGRPPGHAAFVIRPRDTSEVRAVVSWARRHRIGLLPQGANTGLVGASSPGLHRPVAVLSTELMVGPIAVDPAERTAVVSAGTRLSALESALRPHGLTFPIDLAADPSIGGMVATNTGGARMIRHGDLRRHLLGVEAVLADEDVTVVADMSGLRKDNTGLRLSDLFVGSSGALGVITRAALSVNRRPTAIATAALAVRRAGVGLTLLLEERLGEHLSALEAMSAEAVTIAIEELHGLRSPFAEIPALTLLVEVSTTAPAGSVDVEALLGEALSAASEDGWIEDGLVLGPTEAWALRHALTEGLARRGVVMGFDVSVPRSRLEDFRDVIRAQVASVVPRAVVADFGHWGDGGLHCNVVVPGDPPTEAERVAVRDVVYGAIRERGGSFSAEHGIGPLNADLWRSVKPEGVRSLSGRLKALVDPLGILGHPELPYAGSAEQISGSS